MIKVSTSLDSSTLVKTVKGNTDNNRQREPAPTLAVSEDQSARDTLDEDAHIRAAKLGDLESFNKLVLCYQDRVYNQAYHILGNPMEAEDAAQEAFISAFRALSTFRGGSFISWLLRIVTNKCLDELRRRKNYRESSFDLYDHYGEEIEYPFWSADPRETPEERLMRGELSDSLRRCLDRLNPNQRTILVLVDVLGMTYQEAASATGWPQGTVKSRLARARIAMQTMLRDNL